MIARFIITIVVLSCLFRSCPLGGPGGGGPGGAPPRSVSEYELAAERLMDAINADDAQAYQDVMSTRRRGRGSVQRVMQLGRDMIAQQGTLSEVSRVVSGPRGGAALLNAERGGWILNMQLDSSGRIMRLSTEAQ